MKFSIALVLAFLATAKAAGIDSAKACTAIYDEDEELARALAMSMYEAGLMDDVEYPSINPSAKVNQVPSTTASTTTQTSTRKYRPELEGLSEADRLVIEKLFEADKSATLNTTTTATANDRFVEIKDCVDSMDGSEEEKYECKDEKECKEGKEEKEEKKESEDDIVDDIIPVSSLGFGRVRPELEGISDLDRQAIEMLFDQDRISAQQTLRQIGTSSLFVAHQNHLVPRPTTIFHAPSNPISEADLEAAKRRDEKYEGLFEALLKTGDLQTADSFLAEWSFEILPERVLRVLTAAIYRDDLEAFKGAVTLIKDWNSLDSKEYLEFLKLVSQPRVAPAHLPCLLKAAKCAPNLLNDLGGLMTQLNTRVHQIFASACPNHIPRSIGLKLMRTKFPDALYQYWASLDSTKVLKIGKLCPVMECAAEDKNEVITGTVGDFEFAMIVENRDQFFGDFDLLVDDEEIQTYCETIGKTSSKFALLRYNCKTKEIWFAKSGAEGSPAFAILHKDDFGYKIDSELQALYTNGETKLGIYKTCLQDGGLVVGLPAILASSFLSGFNSGFMDILTMMSYDDIDELLAALMKLKEFHSFEHRTDFIIGLISTEDKVTQ